MRYSFYVFILTLAFVFPWIRPTSAAPETPQKNRLDSLEKSLKEEEEHATHPAKTLKLLNELCWELKGVDPEEALRYGNRGLTMAQEYLKNSTSKEEALVYKKAIATTLNTIGVVYDFKSDYRKALQFYLKALEMNEELGEKRQVAACLNNVGIIYYYLGDYLQTLKYYKRALALREELKDEEGVAGSLNNIALVYINQVDKTGEMTNLDEAVVYLQRSLAIKEKLGDVQGVAGAYGNIGSVYKFRAEQSEGAEDFAAAIDYYFRALTLFKELGDQKGMAITFLDISDVHKMQKSYKQAVIYAENSIRASKSAGATGELKIALQRISEIYALTGEYAKAFRYQLDYSNLKDSLLNQETARRIVELESSHKHKEQVKQNELLAKENEILASESRTQSVLRNSLIIMLLLVLVVSILLYIRYKEKRKGDAELEKLSMVASKTDNYVIITDKFDRIEWVNEGFTRITGYILQEVLDKRPEVLLRGPLTDPKTELSIETKRRRGSPFSEEILNYTKYGKPIWLSLGVNPVLNEQGMLQRYITIGNDITKKRHAEDEIKKLSLIASKTDNFVVLSDRDDKVEWVNEGFTRLLGYPLSEIKGKRLRDFLAGRNTEVETLKRIQSQKQKKLSFREELINYKKNGDEVWLSYNITPILDDYGEVNKFINIGSDVTEDKKSEAKLQAIASKLKLINEVDTTLLHAETFNDIVQFTINKLYRELDISRVSMVLFDFKNKTFTPFSVSANPKSSLKEGIVLPLSDFDGVSQLRKFKNYLVQDLKAKEKLSGSDMELVKEGINSYLLCPLVAKNDLLGSLNICCDEQHYFTSELISMVEEIAKGVAIALYHRQLHEKIEERNAALKSKNDDITYSIRYARKIQEAVFPSDLQIQALVENCFVLFIPKEIVSGDFVWARKEKDKLIIAVADCTGHGVPGAFMSLIGYSQLNTTYSEQPGLNPAKTLALLNNSLHSMLISGDDKTGIRDGIDISLCAIDLKTGKLEFAGNNPAYIIRGEQLIELKGDRHHVGLYAEDGQREFTLRKYTLKQGDDIYLFSDGFADQFGGSDRKKYKYFRFKDKLRSIHSLPLEAQKDALKKELWAWRNPSGDKLDHIEQTDDVCVIGIRL